MKRSSSEKYSPATRALIRSKALDQGKSRYDAVVRAVTVAMRTIEKEIKSSDGLYPANGGALTFNELMRRSEISLKTLFGPKYKDGFKKEVVDPWLERIKTAEVSSRREARKSVANRVSEWRELYEDLLKSHRKSELDLQEAQRKLEEVAEQVGNLSRENARLQKALGRATAGKVVPLGKKVRE